MLKFNENEYIQNTGMSQLGYLQNILQNKYPPGLESVKPPINRAIIFNIGSIALFVSLVCVVIF